MTFSVDPNSTNDNITSNLRRIYLNGVSVELIAQNPDGSVQVQVRFDDVDVNNDARWCADEIQLDPVATSTGYSLNVTAGNTITLDRGTTATRRDAPETWNGQEVFTSPTLMRCPANTWLNLAPNSGFTVDNGSTLRLESGSRMDIGNGAVLRVKHGGHLELMGGSVLNILPGGQVIIEEDVLNGNDGHLLFFPNARINMEASNSVLEIAGMLDIQDNATFTTSRSGDPNTTYGVVSFTNTDNPSHNVTAGANTRFILRSTSPDNRILNVEQESLYGPSSLLEFSLYNGKATLADNARIVPPVTNTALVNFKDAIVTSNSGIRNTHRGVRLNGQAYVTLDNSTFSEGAYGMYSYNTTLGNSITMAHCSYIDCNTGMYTYDKSIKAVDCKFNKCNNGLVCNQMAYTSYLTDCEALYNAETGVTFQGSAVLNVESPAFNFNSVGLSVAGAKAFVSCGSVSKNRRWGFYVNHAGYLFMDLNHEFPHEPVTAVDNGVIMMCQQANNVYLDQGQNSLRPVVTGAQNTLYGTFLCQPYGTPQPARKNNWNGTVGTPLTPADYYITACGSFLPFYDPASIPETPCGGLQVMQAGATTLFANCPDCGLVMNAGAVQVPFNVASTDAMELGMNDSLPANELASITAFHALLGNPIATPNLHEKYLLNYDHALMNESYSDALDKGQLVPGPENAETDTCLAMMTDVQNARIAVAQPGDQDDFIFYTDIERAQTTRAAGKLHDALTILDSIPQPDSVDEQEFLQTIRCWTQTESSLMDSLLGWDDVELAMSQCLGHGEARMMAAEGTAAADGRRTARLHPNPATTEVRVQGFAGEDCRVRIMDVTGRKVVQEVRFTNKTTVPLDGLRPGTYLCRIISASGRRWTGRLVVGR